MKIGYWNLKQNGVWVNIVCPIMETKESLPFKVKRRIVESFKHTERYIKGKGDKGWLGYTKKKNTKERQWFARMGGKPYHEDNENIFFMKEI